DDFLSQHFLGRKCTYGDDRRLTYYCLREGQVVLAPDAVAWTLVPERTGHFAGMTYLMAVLLLAYARSGHYVEAEHPGLSWRSRWGTLLLAPLYGIIHMTLL